MNKRSVGYAIGKLMEVLALCMIVPLLTGLALDFDSVTGLTLLTPEISGFSVSILLTLAAGLCLTAYCRRYREDIGIREGYAVVTLGWMILTFFGCLPLVFFWILTAEHLDAHTLLVFLTDAYFETMSGFTTTGSTILSNVEAIPRGILFWRSMTHWLGGMGIITLALAIFPAMGVTGYGMFAGEVPGPTKERLMPRLSETAKILWGVYLLFTLVETLLLYAGGMPLFESLCHTFGTLATGGFSTMNLSIGEYHNLYFHWVIVIFMFLSGINYLVHYKVLLKGELSISWKDRELRFYSAVIVVSILIVTASLLIQGLPETDELAQHYRFNKIEETQFATHVMHERELVATPMDAFNHAAFQVVSIVTTTGFCTADFDLWPDITRYLLVVLMFFGGCAGSTGGGLKMIRIMAVFGIAWREIRKLARPRWIAPMKVAGSAMSSDRVINILALFNLFIILFVVCTGLMTLFVPDLVTAATSVAATLCNIGPGLNGVSAYENYSWIPIPGKWILSMCMLLGRLEIFSVLVALKPSTWRK